MIIVGLSCHYHDAAACVVVNGRVVAAAEEERFTRRKHDEAFPREALNFCLQKAGVLFSQVDRVVFYEKPYLKFARTLFDHLHEFPFSLPHFVRAMPSWLSERLVLPEYLKDEITLEAPVSFVPHHLSHAAFTYFLSGYDEAAILTLDGVGEWSTATRGVGRGGKITLDDEIRYPDSLGLFYSAIAEHLGFTSVGGEGKLMGLAAHGTPGLMDEMRKIIEVQDRGDFYLDPSYFAFRRGRRMGSNKLVSLLGPPRGPKDEITDHHRNIAASAQRQLQKAIWANALAAGVKYKTSNLCLGGGVGLNCLANGFIQKQAEFKNVFVPPGCGDSGGAIGAALFVGSLLGEKPAPHEGHAYWGPGYLDREIEREIRSARLAYKKFSDEEIVLECAQRLKNSQILGWFQGDMEFGPRALGHRSILANPSKQEMRDRVNELKRREKFRPFAPVVPRERAKEFFELSGESPFMLFATQVRGEWREKLPAITHVDGSARAQTLAQAANPLLHSLLGKMDPPVLLNTSFNLDDEPIVCTPADALRTFQRSKLDALAIGPFLVTKERA